MTGNPTEPIQQRWQQGSLLSSGGYTFVTMSSSDEWFAELSQPSEPSERWLVASQDCDILSTSEPYVEVMACYWSPRGASAYTGAVRHNSHRYFMIKEQEHNGQRGALVVDATRRTQVKKEALFEHAPIAIDAEDPDFAREFRQWLGGRYSRPPLPTEVVNAIQRPIVDGIKTLAKIDPQANEAQEKLIREVRIHPLEAPPYDVQLIVLIKEEVSDEDERLAAFLGQVETWLREEPAKIRSVAITTLRASNMYVSEYENTLRLSLDQYSTGISATEPAEPVQGIDHG